MTIAQLPYSVMVSLSVFGQNPKSHVSISCPLIPAQALKIVRAV